MLAIERFETKVNRGPGCWVWAAGKTSQGYAQFWDGSRQVKGHRFAYEAYVGPIPEGLTLDHRCRNRACVNPAHLEPVSQGENVRRGAAAGTFGKANRAKTHCPHGHPYDEANTRLYRGLRHCRTCEGWRGQRLQ